MIDWLIIAALMAAPGEVNVWQFANNESPPKARVEKRLVCEVGNWGEMVCRFVPKEKR